MRHDIDPSRIAFSGDSAGGGLLLGALVALRDARDPLPAAGVALSPWTDMTLSGESVKTRADVDPMVTPSLLALLAGHYLAGADPRQPTASPIYANLDGLPPLLVQVGTAEVLLDDAARFADRARDAGVDIEFEPLDEMIHVWHTYADTLPEARQAIDRIGEFLAKRWA